MSEEQIKVLLGEFEKRSYEYTDILVNMDINEAMKDKWIKLETVGDARKEFPSPLEIQKLNKDLSGVYKFVEWSTSMMEWFEKWFGDVK